jgi:uncharacterized protein YwqG
LTGSLQIRNGKYHAVLNYKDESGKRKQKWICLYLPVKDNKRKAEQRLAELLTEYSDTTFTEPTETLLCDYVSGWVETSKHRVQRTTYDVYYHMLNLHIYPYFKRHKVTLNNVTPYIIKTYYTDKLKEGLSPNTVIKHHAVIRSALQQA